MLYDLFSSAATPVQTVTKVWRLDKVVMPLTERFIARRAMEICLVFMATGLEGLVACLH